MDAEKGQTFFETNSKGLRKRHDKWEEQKETIANLNRYNNARDCSIV